MTRKEIYDYFHSALPKSASVECSSQFQSMLHLPGPESLDTDETPKQYNEMSLDDLDASRDMLRARKNERADLAGAAIAKGKEIEEKNKLKLPD